MNKLIITITLLFATQVFSQAKEGLSVEDLILQLGHSEYKERALASKLLEEKLSGDGGLSPKSEIVLENLNAEIFLLGVDLDVYRMIKKFGVEEQEDSEIVFRSLKLLKKVDRNTLDLRVDGVHLSQNEKGWVVGQAIKDSPFNTSKEKLKSGPLLEGGFPFYLVHMTPLCVKNERVVQFEIDVIRKENPSWKEMLQKFRALDKEIAESCGESNRFDSIFMMSLADVDSKDKFIMYGRGYK